MPELDPIAIMSEHEGDHWCNEGGQPNLGVRLTLLAPTCLPYRLAEALANGLPEWKRAALQDEVSEIREVAKINGCTAELFERERNEACEALMRVEAFVEQLETEKFWLELGGSPVAAVAARIRAELRPRP